MSYKRIGRTIIALLRARRVDPTASERANAMHRRMLVHEQRQGWRPPEMINPHTHIVSRWSPTAGEYVEVRP